VRVKETNPSQSIVGVWRNKHTKDLATITGEPYVNVFELTYADSTLQLYDEELRKCRWNRRDLLLHWKPVHTNIADLESEDEEE
tara:strand:+ start:528 stop:779 length:252 start_codon:yes stop_codon:yes gene_type:complete